VGWIEKGHRRADCEAPKWKAHGVPRIRTARPAENDVLARVPCRAAGCGSTATPALRPTATDEGDAA